LFAEDELIRLAPDRWRPERPDPLAHERRMPTDIQEMMYRDCLVYLPQDILLKVDRASMAHSLEVRCPLLDPELMAFAFGLPLTMHRTLWRGKRLVRHAFRDQLPHAVLKRRKQGFAPPVFEWFMGKAGDLLVELLGALPSTGFDNRLVQQMLDRHRRGQRDEGARLWAILVYLLWRTQQAHAI
jgi:asparagine synthase (glutamine-hydrolysing)